MDGVQDEMMNEEQNELKNAMQNNAQNAGTDESTGWSRFRDGFLDTAAKTSPIMAGIRRYVQTSGWKEEQQLKKDQKEYLDLKMQRMRYENRIRHDSEDQLAEQRGIEALKGKLGKQFDGAQGWARMGVEGQNSFFNDPDVKTWLKAQYLAGHVFEMAKGNKESYGILDRELKRGNIKLVDGENGVKFLEFPNGSRMAATKEEMDKLDKKLSEKVAKAMTSHAQIAERFSETDPLLRSYLNYGSEFLKFHGGNAYSALRKANSILEGASPAERSWHMCNMGIKALANQGLSTAVKMEGLVQCLPALKQLGYDVEGFDPKKPSLENVVILDPKNNRKLSLGEFAEIASDNDNLKRTYDKELGLAKEAAVVKKNQEAMNVLLYNAKQEEARLKQQEIREKGKKKMSDFWGDDENSEESEAQKKEIRSALSRGYGEKFDQLNDSQRDKLTTVFNNYNKSLEKILAEHKKKKANELPDQALTQLENIWIEDCKRKGIDPTQYHSPGNSLIRQRRIKKLKEDIASQNASVAQEEKFNEEWENNYHGGDESFGEQFRRNWTLHSKRQERDRENSKAKNEIKEHENVLNSRRKR